MPLDPTPLPVYLYVIPALVSGGAELQTINHVNYLHQEGLATVHLLVLHDDTPLLDRVKLPGDRVYRLLLPPMKFNHYYVTAPRHWAAVRGINDIIRKQGIQVVIAVLNSSHFMARLALLTDRGIRRSVQLVTYYRNVYFQMAPLDSLPKRLFNGLMSRMARVDDGTIFISQAVKADITSNRYVSNRQTVIFNSLPESTPDPALARPLLDRLAPPECFTLVFPGRLHLQKGHFFFLGVFARLIDDLELKAGYIKLFIAGEGPLGPEIAASVVDRGLEPYVEHLGRVDNPMMLSLMSQVNLVVVPSIYEGFGNVAIEALMCGATLLCSDTGGLDEIVEDGVNGYKFKAEDTESCYAKLSTLYRDYNTLKISATAATEDYRQRFTLSRQMERIQHFVTSLN